jgi:hypothetical protein
MRSRKVALSLAALGLGTALVSTAAFAQTYPTGRAANDGGTVQAQTPAPTSGQRTGSASNRQATSGGQATPSSQAAPSYPVGRAANDGGMPAAQSGTPSTGAAANGSPTGGTRAASTQSGNGRTLLNSAAPQNTNQYPVGRAANDGGMTTPATQGR